ncbi:hypothetical protein [Erwinia sp. 9145]|uniref:hypothetical protein n=1 Tax=Erwinia sp. 9145 TaxID=1500895 RepID=UPI00055679C6|nr:hypothetical protein [Erwinia sp. 9145]
MQKIKLLAAIDNLNNGKIIGRIGGNIPDIFQDKLEHIKLMKFYLTFQSPDNPLIFVTVFVPEDYEEMINNNIYPNCSVKVFLHEPSIESNNADYTIGHINKSNIVGYNEAGDDSFDFITKASAPSLIQDESYYYENLEKDDYNFWIQIDEDFYPNDLINGNYIFGYGALYLYKNMDEQVVAGFWQHS